MKYKNLAGTRFTRLVAISSVKNKHGRFSWNCKCDCGATAVVDGGRLSSGHTKSCGCLRSDVSAAINRTHGETAFGKSSAEFRSWASMKDRCENKNNKRFSDYGGRGIKICKRWERFENFLNDMGRRPEGFTLERINNNGNYEPINCAWESRITQANNNRHNRKLTLNGTTMNACQWANKLGIKSDIIYGRLHRGWSDERTLTQCVR